MAIAKMNGVFSYWESQMALAVCGGTQLCERGRDERGDDKERERGVFRMIWELEKNYLECLVWLCIYSLLVCQGFGRIILIGLGLLFPKKMIGITLRDLVEIGSLIYGDIPILNLR